MGYIVEGARRCRVGVGGHETLGQEGTLEIRLSDNIVLQKGEQRSKRSVWQAPNHRAGGEAGPRT